MKRLKELRRQRGLTQQQVANDFFVHHSTYNYWETGKNNPDNETLLKLANYFGVSVDYLLGAESTPGTYTKPYLRIPVYGTIPAGVPTDMIDESYIENYEDIDANLTKGNKQYFGLKVKGDSMSPNFLNSDILILRKQDTCESGQYCAVSINHTECTFKKVILKQNGITLQPINPSFEPMFFTSKEIEELPITILGVVVELRRTI